MKEPRRPPAAGPIYLDYNATTAPDPGVIDAMARSLEEDFANPSSTHVYGLGARRALDHARAQVASLLGSEPDEVVFTAGGSESDNLALKGVALRRGSGHIITCQGEHPAVLETCAFLASRGFQVSRLKLDRDGQVDPEAALRAITPRTILISVMHANNETGTIQPVYEIARIARERGILFHTDAAQSVGKIPVRVRELGVDLLTVAGHKLYAPKGVGALFVRRGVELEPLIHGAAHEAGRRAGTEAVHQIVGLGAACEIAARELATAAPRIRALRDRLHRLLLDALPELSLNGHPESRLPNTLNVNFPGVWGSELLDRAGGVAASTGSACHSGETRLSPVLAAMGVLPEVGQGAVRLSLGRPTTDLDIEAAAGILIEAHAALVRRS